MLQSLHIQNYALIESLDIDFHAGFSVITGETGAGKSIILGAIGLLLGQRADMKSIRNGANKCVIEAHFNLLLYRMESFFMENDIDYDAEECILRRELYASGKSRAFINDIPVSLNQMKELGEKLLDIHSQHQNLILNHEDFQINVLDILADDSNELEAYQSSYFKYKELVHEWTDLKEKSLKDRQDEDYIRYQLEQLEEAKLIEGEQEQLEQEADMLNHAEDIKSALFKADQILSSDNHGILLNLKDCVNTLQSLSRIYQPSKELVDRLDSSLIELKDLAHEISNMEEDIEFNPERLEAVNDRLNLLYSLQQKHHVSSVEELIGITEQYRNQLEGITSFDERIHELEKLIENQYKDLIDKAGILTRMRKQAAVTIQSRMQEMLVPLGMPNAQFMAEIQSRKEPDGRGMDKVSFLFSANKNGLLQNVASVASGGEIARVMLSLKAIIAGATQLPTVIFDEIDTGVSGSIAEKMALLMQEMGKNDHQVISITHLPQIAARGTYHYKVYKEDTEIGTNTYIRCLDMNERINEIANMLSGADMTEAALNNAKVLLNNELL